MEPNKVPSRKKDYHKPTNRLWILKETIAAIKAAAGTVVESVERMLDGMDEARHR